MLKIQDNIELSNNYVCFTEDDFLRSVNGMNDEIRYRDVWQDSQKNIGELEVKYITYSSVKGDMVLQKVIKECDKDIFRNIREREIRMIFNKNSDPLVPKECKSTDTTEADTAFES